MSVGDSPIRHDAAAKADGSAVYAGDAVPDGALHAKAVFSGKAHARMVSMSTEAAEATRGVVAVLTAADVPVNEYGKITIFQKIAKITIFGIRLRV